MWYNEFNATFWLSFCTMFFTAMGLSIIYCYKSKCADINFCGIIKVHRNIEAEVELEEKLAAEEKKESDSLNNL